MYSKQGSRFCLISADRIRASLARTQDSPNGDARLAHLDGLRAVALIGVLLFHFRVPFFRGGFLGVDVFFVLSGFLMTRALLLKVDAQNFSLQQFLLSRTLRIYPAHLTTVLATLAGALYVFPISMVPRVANSSSVAALFISNMKFLAENGYHDTASSLKPLLHTWSLCVEVHFYLLWSVLALIGSVEHVATAMVILCTVSLSLQQLAAADSAALFFCSWSRLYEFGFGAAALLLYDKFSTRLSTVLSLIGSLAVGFAMLLAKPHHQPSVLVSLPIVFGTMLLVASPHGIVSRLLGQSKILRHIGKLSYSAYLVHWPAIVLWTFALKNETLALSLALGTTIGLSLVLFYAVENIFRGNGQIGHSRKGILFCFFLVVAVLYLSTMSEKDATFRMKRLEAAAAKSGGFKLKTREGYVKEQLETRGALLRNGSTVWHSKKAAGPYAMVLGDSFSAHLFPLMAKAGRQVNGTGIRETFYMCANGCPPIITPIDAISESKQQTPACKENAKKVIGVLKNRAATIFFINRWQDHMFIQSKFVSPHVHRAFLPPKDVFKRVSRSLKIATKNADRVKVIGLTPHPERPVVECLWKHMNGSTISPTADKSCPLQFEVPEAEVVWNDGFRDYLAREHPTVEYVDVIRNSRLCKGRICIAWDKRVGPMHFDDAGHLTHQGAIRAMSKVTMN